MCVRNCLTPLLALAALGLGGCAGKQARLTPEPAPSVSAAPAVQAAADPDADAILRRVDASRREYREGIDLLAVGDEIGGEFKIATAATDLREAALACARRAPCDLDAVLETYDALLGAQNLAIKLQSLQIDTFEAGIEAEIEREPGTEAFLTPLPEQAPSDSLLKGTELRQLITLNGPVRAAIDDWLTWMRPMLMQAYENYRFLRPQVAPIYEEAGLPEALLFAMMATETGVKVHAFSRAGAAGPLQFIRSTGRRYGLDVQDGFDMRLDPSAATRANVAYLHDQLDALDDNLEKALAAYNGGENRMQALHRRHDGAGLWDSEVYYALPRETREYVPRILAAAWLFLHPEDYGLELPASEAATTRLALRDDIALGELTVCLGQSSGSREGWFRTLRNLNPRFEPGERIPAGTEIVVPAVLVQTYEERCLEGPLLTTARNLHDANYPDEPELIVYTVRGGDTLGRIASRHRCASLGELAAINDIRPPRYTIREGQRIKIPACR